MATVLKEFNHFDMTELKFIGAEGIGNEDPIETQVVLEAIEMGFGGGDILMFIHENIEAFVDGYVIPDESVVDELNPSLLKQAIQYFL